MKKSIIIIAAISTLTLTGCAAMCNSQGIAISASNGMHSGSLGIPGLAIAGAEIGACGAYRIVSDIIATEQNKPFKQEMDK